MHLSSGWCQQSPRGAVERSRRWHGLQHPSKALFQYLSSRSGNQRRSLYLKVSKRDLKTSTSVVRWSRSVTLALCTNLISVSSLSRKKKSQKPAPLYFISFPCGRAGERVRCSWLSRSVGAGQGVPSVVLPSIASAEAFWFHIWAHALAAGVLLSPPPAASPSPAGTDISQ